MVLQDIHNVLQKIMQNLSKPLYHINLIRIHKRLQFSF